MRDFVGIGVFVQGLGFGGSPTILGTWTLGVPMSLEVEPIQGTILFTIDPYCGILNLKAYALQGTLLDPLKDPSRRTRSRAQGFDDAAGRSLAFSEALPGSPGRAVHGGLGFRGLGFRGVQGLGV